MSLALSTFSSLESNRFEAFRRSTFSSTGISKFVAHCLSSQEEMRFANREGARRVLGAAKVASKRNKHLSKHVMETLHKSPYVVNHENAILEDHSSSFAHSAITYSHSITHSTTNNGNNNSPAPPQPPPLADLVAPNTSQEITIIVSTLAKMYAQRLTTAARRVASAEGYSQDEKLLPRHFRTAHLVRREKGVDPGFFMAKQQQQSNAVVPSYTSYPMGNHEFLGGEEAAALGTVDRYQLKRMAAEAAQTAYDDYAASDDDDEEEGPEKMDVGEVSPAIEEKTPPKKKDGEEEANENDEEEKQTEKKPVNATVVKQDADKQTTTKNHNNIGADQEQPQTSEQDNKEQNDRTSIESTSSETEKKLNENETKVVASAAGEKEHEDQIMDDASIKKEGKEESVGKEQNIPNNEPPSVVKKEENDDEDDNAATVQGNSDGDEKEQAKVKAIPPEEATVHENTTGVEKEKEDENDKMQVDLPDESSP